MTCLLIFIKLSIILDSKFNKNEKLQTNGLTKGNIVLLILFAIMCFLDLIHADNYWFKIVFFI